MGFGAVPAGVLEATLPGSAVPVYFIAEQHLFGDRPFFYGYRDDPYRFAFFSRAALDLTIAALGWRPDVVHAHDWHAAPAVTWLATAGQADPRYAGLPTVFTIHNLAHQGTSPWQVFDYLGIQTHRLFEEPLRRSEFHGPRRLPRDHDQHRQPDLCAGDPDIRGRLRPRRPAPSSPLRRSRHPQRPGLFRVGPRDRPPPRRLVRRRVAGPPARQQAALQERAGLPTRDDVPLVAMVTRLDWQKGLDITGHVLHLLLNDHAGEAQCVVLGAGAPGYEEMLRHLAAHHGGKMTAFLGYDAELAPLIYGGSDVFLMPSLFEPCGLGQLIAMRYGCAPVVRATGGLADTVRAGVTGFTFLNYSADDFWNALREALFVYRNDPESWRAIQVKGMTSDFSWESSARAYQQLYGWAIARMRGG